MVIYSGFSHWKWWFSNSYVSLLKGNILKYQTIWLVSSKPWCPLPQMVLLCFLAGLWVCIPLNMVMIGFDPSSLYGYRSKLGTPMGLNFDPSPYGQCHKTGHVWSQVTTCGALKNVDVFFLNHFFEQDRNSGWGFCRIKIESMHRWCRSFSWCLSEFAGE